MSMIRSLLAIIWRFLREASCWLRTGHAPDFYRLAMTSPPTVYTRCAHCGAVAWSKKGFALIGETK